MSSVIGNDHALLTDEKSGVAPLRDFLVTPDLRLLRSLVPGMLQCRISVATGSEGILDAHGSRSDVMVRFWTRKRLDGQRCIQFKCPPGKIISMTTQIRHGTVPKIPPAIPFRSRKIDIVEGTVGSGPDPQVPIQKLRHGMLFLGGVVGRAFPSPRPADPSMGFADLSDGA